MLYASLSACVLLANPSPAALFIPLGAAAYPFLSLRAKANTVRKRVIRSLPELATLVAAEMSAGTSPDQALQRAGVCRDQLVDYFPTCWLILAVPGGHCSDVKRSVAPGRSLLTGRSPGVDVFRHSARPSGGKGRGGSCR